MNVNVAMQRFVTRTQNRRGFTLMELLISIAILGIIMGGLQQGLKTAISAYQVNSARQDLLARGRYAMERMAMFIRQSDAALYPNLQADQEILQVSERVLDTYNNLTHAYDIDGDQRPDADNDADGLINEDSDSPDPPDYITFDLDKSDAANWKLQETRPDYSTAAVDDFNDPTVLTENVTAFRCNRLAANLFEIELDLDNGISAVSLKTRIKTEFIEEN